MIEDIGMFSSLQIAGYELSTVLWYFIIYSVLGWCLEVVYCTVCSGKVENRGFLDGPVCPIYGFGMLLIIFLIRIIGYSDVSECPAVVLFFGGMILASAIELLAGWCLMHLFHMRWWNYSDKPFNIGGYICLKFSLYWGLGTLMVIKLVHIPLTHIVEESFLSGPYCYPLLAVFMGIYFVDLFCTVRNIMAINHSLDRLEELNNKLEILSEELSQKIGSRALEVDHRLEEKRAEIEELRRQRETEARQFFAKFEGNHVMGLRRIFHIQHTRNNERIRRLWEAHHQKHDD